MPWTDGRKLESVVDFAGHESHEGRADQSWGSSRVLIDQGNGDGVDRAMGLHAIRRNNGDSRRTAFPVAPRTSHEGRLKRETISHRTHTRPTTG